MFVKHNQQVFTADNQSITLFLDSERSGQQRMYLLLLRNVLFFS